MIDLKLSDRERIFVLEYAKTSHGVNSAIAAGYGSPHVMGCKVLKRKRIIDAIALAKKNPLDDALFVKKVLLKLPAIKKPKIELLLKDPLPEKIVESLVARKLEVSTFTIGENKSAAEAYMESLVVDEYADPRLRFEAAKALLPYRLPKLAETGKKEEKQEAAKAAGKGKFAATGTPPILRAVR